jgi:hypothetical protein
VRRLILGLGIVTIWLLMSSCSAKQNDSEAFRYFPKMQAPKHLYVINKTKLSPEEVTMISSLQGVIAQGRPEIYLNDPAYDFWLADLKANYGVTTEEIDDPWVLVARFKDRLHGFITYENHSASVNTATSLAGLKQAIAVEKSLVARVKSLGLVQVEDVSDKDDSWLYKQAGSEFSKSFLIQQDPENASLRDYGVAQKAMYLYDSASPMTELPGIFNAMTPDAPVLGWGPGTEDNHVGLASMYGKPSIATDWAFNLSALSGVEPRKAFKQTYHVKAGKMDPAQHYVTFVMSDGDNVQWLLNDFARNEKYFGSEARGKFPMGWQLAPTLSDLAPSVMSWAYRNARTDYFVAGVSGTGYMYPNDYPKEALQSNLAHLDTYLKRTDMNITTILDRARPTKEVMEQYAAVPSLKGAIVLYGDRYVGGGGKMWWLNGKPFASARETLWESSPEEMAQRINGYPVDPKREEGYTIINVHPWSETMSDVQRVVEHLDAHLKVVSPEELFDRMIRDVAVKSTP